MNARIEVTPKLLTKARYLYEHTLTPVDDIAAMLGMSKTPFYKRVQEGGLAPRRVRSATGEFARVLIDGALTAGDFAVSHAPPAAAAPPPIPDAALQPGGQIAAEPIDRVALAARLMKVVERHIAAIERMQAVILPARPVEVERNARTLAVMGRTMREIQVLLTPPKCDQTNDSDANAIPIDADEFRRALAEKLEGLLAAERRRESEDHGGVRPAGA